MLKKLLKYDFRSIFKYWWIAALSSFVLSLAGIFCLDATFTEADIPFNLRFLSILGIMLVYISIAAFSILTFVMIFARFYRNFFTDEGYLTFTLPVKRSHLLTSKIITGVTALAATSVICIIDFFVMFSGQMELFTAEFWKELAEGISGLWNELGFYFVIYIVEILLIFLLCTTFSCQFLYCCITVGSIIAKRAKVITAIAVYYGANTVFSFVMQIFMLFGIYSMEGWINQIPTNHEAMIVALFLLGITFFLAVCCMLLYTLQYWMLDRKLNLN